MRLRITAAAESADRDLTRLYGWFERVEELRRGARISLDSQQRTGAMGMADVINIVLTQGIAAGSLGVAYATYRRANPKSPAADVTPEGGQPVRLPDDPEQAERMMLSMIENDPEPDPGIGGAGDDAS